jgi:hypothetical protein
MAPRAARRGGLKLRLPAYRAGHSTWWSTKSCHGVVPRCVASDTALTTLETAALVARTATPGQAGLPAEFKHINKRRRRNLQGFP